MPSSRADICVFRRDGHRAVISGACLYVDVTDTNGVNNNRPAKQRFEWQIECYLPDVEHVLSWDWRGAVDSLLARIGDDSAGGQAHVMRLDMYCFTYTDGQRTIDREGSSNSLAHCTAKWLADESKIQCQEHCGRKREHDDADKRGYF